MQQMLRPLDHVSDGKEAAGRAQRADVTNDSKLGGEKSWIRQRASAKECVAS